MGITVRHEGASRAISAFKVMFGGTLRTIRSVKVMQGGELRTVATFAPPMTLSVTPAVSGDLASPFGSVVSSDFATATPSGGIGPFTYAWSKVSGSTLGVSAPNNATTLFSTSVLPGQTVNAVYRCTCTDSFGQTATGDCAVTLTNNDLS